MTRRRLTLLAATPLLTLLAAGTGCLSNGYREVPTAILKDGLPDAYHGAVEQNATATRGVPSTPERGGFLARDNRQGDTLPPRDALGPNAPAVRLDGQVTLADCLRTALARSETLASNAEDYVQALLRQDALSASVHPDVSAGFRYTIENQQDGGGGPDSSGGSFNERDSYTADITATTPLWHGFAQNAAMRGYQALSRSTARSLVDTRNKLALDVTERYYTALQATRAVAVQRSQVSLNEARVGTMRKLVEAGAGRKGELLTTQADLAQSKADLERALETQRLSRERLGYAVGARIDGDLVQPDARARRAVDLDVLIVEALAHRPDLAAVQELITARREALRAKRRALYPDLDAAASVYPYRDGGDEEKDWEITITAELALYRSGRWLTEVRNLQSQLRQAELAVQQQRRLIDLDVRESVAELESSDSLLLALQEQQTAATEAHRQVQREFDAGAASNLELTTAQTALLAARLGLETETLRNEFLYRRLRAITGHFIDVDTQ